MKIPKNITPGPMDPQEDVPPPAWRSILAFALGFTAVVFVVYVCLSVHSPVIQR